MPQFVSPFTINDGSATPAAVSYNPEKLSSSDTILVDRREASRESQPSIAFGFDPATSARKTYKVSRTHAFPLTRAVNGVPLVTDVARARIVYTLPTAMTAQERKHFHAMVANAEDHTAAKASVVDLDPLY